MKECTKCKKNKPLTDYGKSSYKLGSGYVAACKACTYLVAKARGKVLYEVESDGLRACNSCKIHKKLTEFDVNKVRKKGRQYKCKECFSAFIKNKRHSARKNKIENHIRCEVCKIPILKKRTSHRRCDVCSTLVRDLQSHLSGSRKNKIRVQLKITVAEAVLVAIKNVSALDCCYCGRSFSENKLKKSIDHIIPICMGGCNLSSNIAISCIECNFSKNKMQLNNWIALCEEVVKNKESIKQMFTESYIVEGKPKE